MDGSRRSVRWGARFPTPRWVRLALSALLLWAPFAEAEPPTRLGFFEVDGVFKQTGLRQQARGEWELRLDRKRRALRALEQELDRLNERFRLEGASLPPERRKEMEETIERKYGELSRGKEQYQKELLSLERGVQVRAGELVRQAAAEIGQEQGFSAILEQKQAGLYYLQKELDLTDAIAKRVKKKMEAEQARKTSEKDGPASTDQPPPAQPSTQ
jgi:Skp family chaperone for outer membrane proteins